MTGRSHRERTPGRGTRTRPIERGSFVMTQPPSPEVMFLFIWKRRRRRRRTCRRSCRQWCRRALRAVFEQEQSVPSRDVADGGDVTRSAAHVDDDDAPRAGREMRRCTSAGSRQNVLSISASTGMAPRFTTAAMTATQRYAGTMTSWPGPTPRTAIATCSAPVPLLTASACFAPAKLRTPSRTCRLRIAGRRRSSETAIALSGRGRSLLLRVHRGGGRLGIRTVAVRSALELRLRSRACTLLHMNSKSSTTVEIDQGFTLSKQGPPGPQTSFVFASEHDDARYSISTHTPRCVSCSGPAHRYQLRCQWDSSAHLCEALRSPRRPSENILRWMCQLLPE